MKLTLKCYSLLNRICYIRISSKLFTTLFVLCFQTQSIFLLQIYLKRFALGILIKRFFFFKSSEHVRIVELFLPNRKFYRKLCFVSSIAFFFLYQKIVAECRQIFTSSFLSLTISYVPDTQSFQNNVTLIKRIK